MPIANFPSALQPAIQEGFLEREFQEGLRSTLVFRSVADPEVFSAAIGETLTKTRKGLKAPVTTPLNPASNTNLDNGLTPSSWTIEQYTYGINMYGDTIDLNTVTQGVGIQRQFLHNASANGIQAGQSVDRLARNTLYQNYLGGHTRVTATLGAPGTTIAVDDIRGFTHAILNGKMEPVGAGNPRVVKVGANEYSLIGVAADGVNVSTAISAGGISGTLTFSANVTVNDGTQHNAVVAKHAPTILRAGARSTTRALQPTDLFTMGIVLDAVTQLRNNAVPTVNGLYNCYCDNVSARQLFADPDFKLLYQGSNAAEEFRNARVVELLDVRFLPTTEALQQQLNNGSANLNVHRPIVVGAGALIEGIFEDTGYEEMAGQGVAFVQDGIAQVVRPPIDRLNQIVAQSWYYIGGFVCPTDVTANTQIIPTASDAYLKRAVAIEHA